MNPDQLGWGSLFFGCLLAVALLGAATSPAGRFVGELKNVVRWQLGGPVIRHQNEPDEDGDGLDAEIAGEVRLDGECVFVGEFLTVWPYGTSWDADLEAVNLPNGDTVPLGGYVYGGGGYFGLDTVDESIGQDAIKQAEGCVSESAEVAVINNDSEAIGLDATKGTAPPHSGEPTVCGIPFSETAESRYPNFWFAEDLSSAMSAFDPAGSEGFGGLETETTLVDSVVYKSTVPVDEELKLLEGINVTVRWPADTETVTQPGYELALQETDHGVHVWVGDRSVYEHVVAVADTDLLNQIFGEADGCTSLSITFEYEGETYGPLVIDYTDT